MKKLVALLLAIVMVVGIFAGCNTEKPVETKPQETQGGTNKPAETQPAETEKAFSHPVTTDPITITILTTRHNTATNNASDTWFMQWLPKWLHDTYGYNVTIDIQQTMEAQQQVSLMLGTDTLPDIVWGIPLTTNQAVVYGDGEGMILDWREYLNDTYMPNASKMIYDPQYSSILLASTAPSGAIYGMPHIGSKSYGTAATRLGASNQDRMFFYLPWLEENGLKMPTNMEEFFAICEAYKGKKTEDGQDVIPVIGQTGYLEKAFWTMLGYYGSGLSTYGTEFAIKNGQVELPVYTEDYATLMEIMYTMYSRGYVSPDHVTMNKETTDGLTKAGVAGIVSAGSMTNLKDFQDWDCLPWFPISEGYDLHISTGSAAAVMQTWASADTEYPEVVALILDYLYTAEGAAYYTYGPKEGQDPLGLVDGWIRDEKGALNTKLVLDGVYDSFVSYCYQYIYPYQTVAKGTILLDYGEGLELIDGEPLKEFLVLDTVTGEYISSVQKKIYDHTTAQGHWFLSNGDVSEPYITFVFLPAVYMTEEDALYAAELKTILDPFIISESAKFITGQRPISEIPQFQEELKAMGIEDYIAMYREAYSTYMDGIFG